VWNAHNTVLGSKLSAISAQAVYFLHSTRPSVTWLNIRWCLAACDWILDSFYDAFGGVHTFCYNSAESEPIWMKCGSLWVHCRRLDMADFRRHPPSSDSCRARRNFVFFCQVNNARFHRLPVGQISRNLNRTTSIGIAMKTSGTEFWNFYLKESFFKKSLIFSIFNVLRFQAAITPQWLQISENSLSK